MTKQFTKGMNYTPKEGDSFSFFDGDWKWIFKDGRWGNLGVSEPEFLPGRLRIGDLLNYIPNFTIYREVPDEPYVTEQTVCRYAGGEPYLYDVSLPKDQFKDGDLVTVTVTKEQK